ncbi:MAG: hypothetical protein KKF68_02360 [Nanoarchaeota archaeon]|nr:hypothetical protein [Nanoarchaeota archaeon]
MEQIDSSKDIETRLCVIETGEMQRKRSCSGGEVYDLCDFGRRTDEFCIYEERDEGENNFSKMCRYKNHSE